LNEKLIISAFILYDKLVGGVNNNYWRSCYSICFGLLDSFDYEK